MTVDSVTGKAKTPYLENINHADCFDQMPEELILRVFRGLNLYELAKCGEVSRRWKRLTSDLGLWNAFDLKQIFPSLKIFYVSDWASHVDLPAHGIPTQRASFLDKRKIIPVLKRSISNASIIEENAGWTLFPVLQGFTVNKIIEIAKCPKNGSITPFDYRPDIPDRIRDIPIDKTYYVLISNHVFCNSRALDFSAQNMLVTRKGYEIPKAIEMAALLVITFMISEERLYKETYTRCQEKYKACPLIVGSLPQPDYGYISYNRIDRHMHGVGGIVRF